MPRTYQPKLLEDGTPNPKFKPDTRKRKRIDNRVRSDSKTRLPDGSPNPAYRRRNGKHVSLFDRGQFVAIDGEGGEIDGVHKYLMMMASDGKDSDAIFNPTGLTTVNCFGYLMSLKEKFPKGIFVIFAGGYDGNLWLRDIPKDVIEQIVAAKFDEWIWWQGWGIRFKQRKYFALCNTKIRDNKNRVKTIMVYDVHGFFQSSFVQACRQWIPGYENLDLIIEGKKLRTAFTADQIDFMTDYTTAELEALCLIMRKLRDACTDLDIKLTRFDGAGAIAAAIYKKHDVKTYFDDLPVDVQNAAMIAYFGGRIESMKVGHHEGTIHHYDINSAYPSKQVDLPALAGGEWVLLPGDIFVDDYDNVLMVSRVKWSIPDDEIIAPFPFRSEIQNKVLFPTHGHGWYWKPEISAAQQVARNRRHWHIDVQETWAFFPDTDYKPFGWIAKYYAQRQSIVKESKRTGIPNGTEKAIKLGINSLYGKLAQRVGYDPDKGADSIPPFHNLAYAGHITSATRAQLFLAGMQSPESIICLATDGIYSTSPLTLDCPKEKVLGAWEYNIHDSMTMVQSGVYFLREGDELFSYSRGFDKMNSQEGMRENLQIIRDAWKNKEPAVLLPCTRFVTLKSALIGGDWWQRWLTWHEFRQPNGDLGRRLAITPQGTKRQLVDPFKTKKYHVRMEQTIPEYNFSSDDELSAPHNIPWHTKTEFSDEMELIQEFVVESVD